MAGSTVLSGRNLQAFIPLITGPLIDNAKVGAMGVVIVDRAITGTDTVLTHQLGRVPNGFLAYRNSSGGVVYDASDGVASWTETQVVLRTTVDGTFSVLLI